ncbi:MAG: TolC family protein [Schleiferiaceae bacterium]|nr:TolC family protein [Schleiferiaceae bacterium]
MKKYLILFLLPWHVLLAQVEEEQDVIRISFSSTGNSSDSLFIDSLAVHQVFDLSVDLSRQLPSLDTLFAIARQYSPMVNKNVEFYQAQIQKIKLEKRRYWKHISLFANYSEGNQGLIIPGEDVSQLMQGYRYGVNLQFPLEELMTRRARVKLAKHEAFAYDEMRKEMEILLHRDIVRLYTNLIKYQRQMNLHQDFLAKARINERVAERQYRENQIKLMDYTRISEIRALAESRFEDSSAEFYQQFFELEVVLGQPLYLLKR